jgi:hypothetical protein
MKTEHDLNEKINQITNTIREKHPELIHFLNEIPITIPNKEKPEINLDILTSYYKTLKDIFDKYTETHQY